MQRSRTDDADKTKDGEKARMEREEGSNIQRSRTNDAENEGQRKMEISRAKGHAEKQDQRLC